MKHCFTLHHRFKNKTKTKAGTTSENLYSCCLVPPRSQIYPGLLYRKDPATTESERLKSGRGLFIPDPDVSVCGGGGVLGGFRFGGLSEGETSRGALPIPT